MNNCMHKCKITLGCNGFIYNNDDYCELYYKPINDNKYNRCNKLSTAYTQPQLFEDYRGNATFLCANENDDAITYYIYTDKPEMKKNLLDVYDTKDINEYKLFKKTEISDEEKEEIVNYFIPQSTEIIGKKQCSMNVPLELCMLNCKNHNNCIGIDWLKEKIIFDNEVYKNIITLNNICCEIQTFEGSKKIKVDNINNNKYYIKI